MRNSQFGDEGIIIDRRESVPSAKDAINKGLDDYEEQRRESEEDAYYEDNDYPTEELDYSESEGNLEAGAKYFTDILKNLKGELVGIYYPRISMDHDGGFEVPMLSTRNNTLKAAVLDALAHNGYRQGGGQPLEWGGPQPLYDETLHSVTKTKRDLNGKTIHVTTTYLGINPISKKTESTDRNSLPEFELHGLPVLAEHYMEFTRTSETLMSQYRAQNNLTYDGRPLSKEDMEVIKRLQNPEPEY